MRKQDMGKRQSCDKQGMRERFGWALYSLSCALHRKFPGFKKGKSDISSRKRGEILFICAVLAVPMFIFAVFYVGVNFNSLIMAFQEYDPVTKHYFGSENPWGNFAEFFIDLREEEFMGYALINSFTLFVITMFVNLPLHIIIAYYIYKKNLFYRAFRFLLFLPSILSSVITVTLFKYFLIYGLQSIYTFFGWGVAPQLINDPDTGFQTILAYSVWINFGGGLIMFLGLMNRISPSVLEAAALDGAKPMQEFVHIIFPLIFPTVSIYIVNNIATIFSAQGALYTFYGSTARKEFYTFGYYYYTSVIGESGVARYPMAAASGLIFTAIVAPVTLLARKILDKINPTVDL